MEHGKNTFAVPPGNPVQHDNHPAVDRIGVHVTMAAPSFAAATPGYLDALIRHACAETTGIPAAQLPDAPIRRSTDQPGQYLSPLPLRLAGRLNRPARDLAADIATLLRHQPRLTSVQVTGPGFVALTPVPSMRTALAQVIADTPAAYLLDLPAKPAQPQTMPLPNGLGTVRPGTRPRHHPAARLGPR